MNFLTTIATPPFGMAPQDCIWKAPDTIFFRDKTEPTVGEMLTKGEKVRPGGKIRRLQKSYPKSKRAYGGLFYCTAGNTAKPKERGTTLGDHGNAKVATPELPPIWLVSTMFSCVKPQEVFEGPRNKRKLTSEDPLWRSRLILEPGEKDRIRWSFWKVRSHHKKRPPGKEKL